MEKKKVSAFEFAIAEAAAPEEAKNMIPETREEEIERRIQNMSEAISKFKVINPSEDQ